ncbi:MAG: iron ABC transporter permease [Spirochaetales bacterium]|uniref:Iron ABC transporter permease n=1 Tax=Candidatus Thalassospirochaeta sargassi TaxID=3119039 RepID=A0AAJ1IF16_9SPIO|nr:iron ABC transporter permease [Spirochaetales bacterium]
MLSFRKSNPAAVLLTLLIPVIIFVSAAFGAADISFITAVKAVIEHIGLADYDISEPVKLIIMNIRLPRILLSAIAGAGLATAGAVFQAVFQNQLAEPYLLGISSGASLGATIAIIIGSGFLLGSVGSVTFFAFAGSLLTVFLVLAISGGFSKGTGNLGNLLLGGIAVGYIFQAIISFLMMLNQDKMETIVFWMMGSFTFTTWEKVITAAMVVTVCTVIININASKLNILSLGSEEAHSLGVNPQRAGIFFLIVSCMLTAAVVSASGIIGFVGLIVPHLLRVFTGPDHRKLLPASAAGGACLLMLADIAARSMMAPKEIPVGVITAFIGGPFFLIMLRRRRKGAMR